MMILLNELPPQELAMEMLVTGSLDKPLRNTPHSKTCPHAIWAQGIQGHYEITCADGRHEHLAVGEAFLTAANIPLHIIHHGDPDDGGRMRARWLHVQFTLFGSIDVISLLELPLRVTEAQCEPFVGIIDELEDLNRTNTPPLKAMARRHRLGTRFLELLCDLGRPRPAAMDLLGQRERLVPVLEFMKRHLAEKLTVEMLADEVHMSVPHFHAFFRQFMGRPPMRHLKYLRLARACRLLTGVNVSLAEIAGQTGFCSEFHLSREFSREFGKPPGRWRRDYDRHLT